MTKGAEVTLGTAMAGNLYPFVISFSAPQRARPAREDAKQQEQALPPRRNTEDFVFTGVLDPSASASSSSVAGSDAAAGGMSGGATGGGGGRGGRSGMPAAAAPGGGGGLRSGSVSRLTSPYLLRTTSNASGSSSLTMTGGGRKRSDSLGSWASGATRQRKTLHLGCETEEQTLQWAR